MTNEKKIIKGLDKELMQLIDAEMNDPVFGKLLNRNAAYVLGKEIKILFIDKACDFLRNVDLNNFVSTKEGVYNMQKFTQMQLTDKFIEQFKKTMQ